MLCGTKCQRKKKAKDSKKEASKYKRTSAIFGGSVQVEMHDDNIITIGHELGVHEKRGAIDYNKMREIIAQAERNPRIRNNPTAKKFLTNLKIETGFFLAFKYTQLPISIAKTGVRLGFIAASMIPLIGTHALGAADISMMVTQLILGIATSLNTSSYKFDSLNFFNIPIGIKNLEPKKEKQINKYLGEWSDKIDEKVDNIINTFDATQNINEIINTTCIINNDKNDVLDDVIDNKEIFEIKKLISDNKKMICENAKQKVKQALEFMTNFDYEEEQILQNNIQNDIEKNHGKVCRRNPEQSEIFFTNQAINLKRNEYYENYQYDENMKTYISDLFSRNQNVLLDAILPTIEINISELEDNLIDLTPFVITEFNDFKTQLNSVINIFIDDSDLDIEELITEVITEMKSKVDDSVITIDPTDVNNFYNELSITYEKMKWKLLNNFADKFYSATIDLESIDKKEFNKKEFDRAFLKVFKGIKRLFYLLTKKIIVEEVNPYKKCRSFDVIKDELENRYIDNINNSKEILKNQIDTLTDYEIFDKTDLKNAIDEILLYNNVSMDLLSTFKYKIRKEKDIVINNVIEIIKEFMIYD